MEQSVGVRIPGISKAQLIELFDELRYLHKGLRFAREGAKQELAMDPATVVVFVSSGTLILVQLIKSLTEIYLRKSKESKGGNTPDVSIRVELSMGEVVRATVTSADKLDKALAQLPSRIDEANTITLESSCQTLTLD